jgi:hypothetical protein
MSNRRSEGVSVNHDSCFVHKGARTAHQPAQRSVGVPALAPDFSHSMSEVPAAAPTFTPAERDYIRRELDMFFSTFPT